MPQDEGWAPEKVSSTRIFLFILDAVARRKRCCWISASEFPTRLWGNHDYLDAWFLSLLSPSSPCSEYLSVLMLMCVRDRPCNNQMGPVQANSDEFPLLCDCQDTQFTVQLTRRHAIHDTAHAGMQTNDKTPFLIKLLSTTCKTQVMKMSPASSAIFWCSLPIQPVSTL